MRIIQANKFYYLKGGAERYMLDLSSWLTSEGHEVIPFAMRHPMNLQTPYAAYFPRFVKTEGVPKGPGAICTLGRMLYSISARRNMATLIAETGPDLCHLHNIYTQLSPSILHALDEQGIPTIMTVHDHHLISPQYNLWAEGCGKNYTGTSVLEGGLARFHKHSFAASAVQTLVYAFHRKLRIYERFVDTFITPSDYLRDRMIASGFPKEKIRTIPHGIETGTIEPHFEHEGYVLFVGRLSSEKGVSTIIRAAGHLPNIKFKIVGSGPEEDALHRMAHESGNIEFLGFRKGEELRDLYAGAMCVVVPSRVHEIFPLTILEAMAAGKPVVASRVGGIPEVIEDRQTGYLVDPMDLQGWTEAIIRLAHDEENRTRFAKRAREAAENQFSLERHHQLLMQTYEEVIREKLEEE